MQGELRLPCYKRRGQLHTPAQVLGCTVLALLLLSAGRGVARAAARRWRVAPWWYPWCAWGQLTGEEISATAQVGPMPKPKPKP